MGAPGISIVAPYRRRPDFVTTTSAPRARNPSLDRTGQRLVRDATVLSSTISNTARLLELSYVRL